MCSVDKTSIENHYQANLGWNCIPIIGPLLGQGLSPKLPKDDQDDLDDANTKLQTAIGDFQLQVTKLEIKNTQNFHALVNILPEYVDAEIDFKTTKEDFKTNIIIVHIIAISVIIGLIIFLGL